jgi:acetolactate synthase-1/2/3 large subunit
VLEAIGQSPIRLYTARHEAAAANMAEAYGTLTGRPGVCLRHPGARCDARPRSEFTPRIRDSTPLVLLVGQVPRRHPAARPSGARLRADVRRDGEVVTTLEDAAAVPELVSHAFHTATSGRPGQS